MNTLKPLIPLLLLLNITITTRANPPLNYLYHSCSGDTINSTYQSNLNTVLSSLSSSSTSHYLNSFYNASSREPPGVVIQGLSQCRSDLPTDTCQFCVASATTNISGLCPYNTGAVIWYDECLLHYSDKIILSTVNTEPRKCMPDKQIVSTSERLRFNSFVRNTLIERASEAANVEWKFSAKAASGNGNFSDWDQLYTLVQCTQDLSGDQCLGCLQEAISFWDGCGDGMIRARILQPSCYFRYEVYLFYNTSWPLVNPPPPPVVPSLLPPPPDQSGKSRISTVTIVGIVVGICVCLALSCLAYYCFLTRRASNQDHTLQEHKGAIEITSVESLQFSLGTIEAATNSFSKENMLGQGGFGEVHQGMLVDGQEIAVKRLSRGSTQGIEEFKTEVMLVAKLQHKNLVRLLGFCLEGEEKILVYEFVPNKSLDYFLFDPKKKVELDWSKRHKIIKGIARGILYLHEDSRLKIIHRDLKSSNILLDREMNPKISDFGMARIFGVHQAEATTKRIVGTYGYMSPEYAMRGEFSVKSDVYSFGVLTLEIIAGRKNNSFYQLDGFVDLISYVWKHWTDEKPLEVLDPTMVDTCLTNEVARCVHIGLLCVQEDPSHRPTMASVVTMLNSFAVNLPSPQRPGFFPDRTEHNRHVIGTSESENKKNSSLWSVDETSITQTSPR